MVYFNRVPSFKFGKWKGVYQVKKKKYLWTIKVQFILKYPIKYQLKYWFNFRFRKEIRLDPQTFIGPLNRDHGPINCIIAKNGS